jgi:uncharacterized protein (TIGR00266 family)
MAMQHSIEHGPSFAWLRVQLAPGERVDAEAGAMVMQSPAIELQTRLNADRQAGIFAGLWALLVAVLRRLLGKETMFINEFSGPQGGEVVLAPKLSGQIVHLALRDQNVFVQPGSYLASTGSVTTRLRWGGLRALFGGEGMVLLGCSGTGDLWVNAYGGVVEVEVDGAYVVDSGHLVAFDGSLDFRVKGAGGLKSLLFSGEGLVMEFRGRGRVWIQSRNLVALIGWITPLLR